MVYLLHAWFSDWRMCSTTMGWTSSCRPTNTTMNDCTPCTEGWWCPPTTPTPVPPSRSSLALQAASMGWTCSRVRQNVKRLFIGVLCVEEGGLFWGWGCHFSLCSREKCCSTFYMRKSCPVKIRCLHVQLGMGVNGLKMAWDYFFRMIFIGPQKWVNRW